MTATRSGLPASATAAVDDTGSRWAGLLDQRLSAVIADLVRQGDDALGPFGGWQPMNLVAAAARVLADAGLPGVSGRHRATRQQLACYAAVYGRLHRPRGLWQLTGTEPGLLLWRHPRGHLLLDAPRGIHADTPLLSHLATEAADRHHADAGLLGIRLLPLAAPLTGRLLTPDGELAALPDLTTFPPAALTGCAQLRTPR